MRYYIIRREEPFEKGTEELKYSFYGDEDDFTLGAKMVFLGLVYKFISSDIMSFKDETLLNFDVVKDIKSICYIRDQIIQPGCMTDTWREPTIQEYEDIFIKHILKRNSPGYVMTDDAVYKEYLSKKREDKLNELGI